MGARRVLAVMGAVAAAVALANPMSALAASGTADVYVVQGLVGTTADIVVDGNTLAPAAPAKTVVGPLRLTAGDHVVTLEDGATTVVNAKFSVKAGTSSDVVAHRSADTSRIPVVTVFANDLTAVPPDKTRLVVSHVAVAPPADIRVDGKPLFRNVANGESLTLELPSAKTCIVDMVPTATSGPAILDPVRMTLRAGTLTRLFVIGDASAGTTEAVVQQLPVGVVGSERPTSVKTGDGGQAADSFVASTPWSLWLLTGALSAMVGLTVLNRRSRRVLVVGSRHQR